MNSKKLPKNYTHSIKVIKTKDKKFLGGEWRDYWAQLPKIAYNALSAWGSGHNFQTTRKLAKNDFQFQKEVIHNT